MSSPSKAILELIPGVIFFLSYKLLDLKSAVIALMAVTIIILVVMKVKKLKIAPVIMGAYAMALIFGGLTLYTDDTYFIKIKPTILNLIFGAIVIIDRFRQKKWIYNLMPALRVLPRSKLNRMSLYWGLYFVACALLNEVIWRFCEEQTWVYFKIFGFMGLNTLFIVVNILSLRAVLGGNLHDKSATPR